MLRSSFRLSNLTKMTIIIIYIIIVVREVNVRVLRKGLELLSANGGWFEINQLLFADDTALVAERRSCVDW